LPDLGVGGAREDGNRAVLARHRDPVVRLGQYGRLARDGIAQHREAVRGPDGERIEAVEVAEAAFERLLERRPFAQPPREVAGGDLRVVLGRELDALALEAATQAVVVRERAVVHETEVAAGREGAGTLRR